MIIYNKSFNTLDLILILFIILILLLFFYSLVSKNVEHFNVEEVLQNIGSILDTGNMTVSNLTVTQESNLNNTTTNTLNIIPKGVIVAWTGSIAPNGWNLCDGTNGTPDLRGRFILGSGQGGNDINGIKLTNRIVGQNGGEENHVLSNAEMPVHTHYVGLVHCRSFSGTDSGGKTLHDGTNDCSGDNPWYTNEQGGNAPHNNMPPFYVLAFIMKL